MKIILFAEALTNPAGIERMTIELANLLCCHYDVSIILIYDYNKLPYDLDKRVSLFSLHSSFSISKLWSNVYGLRKFVQKKAPDYLITVAVPLVRISALALLGLKTKNVAWEHFNLYAGSKLGFYWRLLSAKLVWKTVVLTKADEQSYRKYVNSDIVCIPNFSPIRFQKKSKIESNILLAVGRLENQKGFDLLLQAWRKIFPSASNWELHIVGSGSLKSSLVKQAEILDIKDSVIFKEATKDIANVYQQASCLVMSSRFEGLPMVLIEAKMAGLPCVSFDCPNGPAEVIRDGIDGYLVPAEDVDALASRLIELLNNRNMLKKMGELAYEDACRRFSAEAIEGKWKNLLEKEGNYESTSCY